MPDNEQYAVDTAAARRVTCATMAPLAAWSARSVSFAAVRWFRLFGACFTNNTGSTITNLAIAYTGEQWRRHRRPYRSR